ncbi:MAG: putative rane associated hydrolase [Gemmatimonadetes bacterium]|nr:putative rane associated hydrolase [Gemmatimonadota bacterium]
MLARVLILAFAAIAAVAGAVSPANGQVLRSQNDPRPGVPAVRRTGPVVIDGKLDDAAWNAAKPISELIQSTPDEGKASSEKTELRFLYDDDALYLSARMYDSQGSVSVRTQLARRDQLLGDNGSDRIAIVLDPFRDRTTRVWFELNPNGVKGDHINGDASYDPVWEGASRIDSLGWTAEMRIPLSQLRFSRDSVQSWGLQVWRTLVRRNEQDMWAFWRNNEQGGAGYFGTLDGLQLKSQPRQLEVLPYAVSRLKYERATVGDPYHRDREGAVRVGGDLKYNLTSSLTLDATANPDFGQVEVDPAVVNLSAFEVSFQEKRPFFVANSSYLGFGNFSCYFCSNVSSLSVFYSRRIGRAPQLGGTVGGRSDFMDVPENSTILGAAKLTGRTKDGWSVGALEALTNRATATYVPVGGLPEQRQEVEPMTNYFVGRLRKDLRHGDTRLGIVSTLTNRFMSDTLETSRLRSRAGVLGADIQHYWAHRTYSFFSQVALSNVAGDTAAMRRTQLSSTHYFQRPDRTVTSDGLFDTRYDPTRTALSGYGFYARVAKETGNWLFEGIQNWRSPSFEVNDAAILGRTDYKWMLANAVRRWTTPGKGYRDIWISAGAQTQYDYEGDRTDLEYHGNLSVTLPNFWSASVGAIYHPGSYDPNATRGGPVVGVTGYKMMFFDLSGDSRSNYYWSLDGNIDHSIETRAWRASASPSLTLKPSGRLLIRLSPSFDRDITTLQYVTQQGDPTATNFYGTRYVFGTLDQRTLSMGTRLNATITPNMTFELYAQPFIASGGYSTFKEYASTRSRDYKVYGRDVGTIKSTLRADGVVSSYTVDPDAAGPAGSFSFGNPDFVFHSLRGTAVARWEYRPGSTLYFVWTQERAGQDSYNSIEFSRDRGSLLADRPTNIFLVKASYWIGN